MTDPSERPTLPPMPAIGDEPLPRDQERLAIRFAADVSKAIERLVVVVEKQGKANELNYKFVLDELKRLRASHENTTLFVSRFNERIESLEHWRDRDGKDIRDRVDALTEKFDEHFRPRGAK